MPREIDDPLMVKAFEAEERKRQQPAAGSREITDPLLVKAFEAKEAASPTYGELAKDVAKQTPRLARGALEIPLAVPRLANLATQYLAPESDFARHSQEWINKTDASIKALGLDPEAETAAGRYAGAIMEAAPGFAMPGVGFGGQIARGVATHIPGQVSRFRPITQAIGGSVLSGAGGEAAQDLGADPLTRGLASVAGGAVGALGAPRAAATLADLWFNQAGNVPLGPRGLIPAVPGVEPGSAANPFIRAQRAPGSPGGPLGPPRPTEGLGPLDAAAYDTLHHAMVQAGVPPERIPETLAAYAQARLARGNIDVPQGRSLAPGEISLMDIDPALQSLAGSISRMSPEGANVIRPVITARQTGAPSRQLDPAMGVRTREPGARIEDAPPEMRGPSGEPLPVGQHENIGELLRRHLEIEDMPYHGHGETARQTGALIAQEQSAQAAQSWGAARAAADGVDIGADPGVQAAVQKWVDRMNNPFTPAAEKALIKRALSNMAPGEGGRVAPSLDDFHGGKMIVDKMISPYYTGIGGEKNARLGAKLVELKNDIQGAVGRIETNDVGPLYRKANAEFAGHEVAQEEMALGEQVWSGRGDKRVRAQDALAPYQAAEKEALSRKGTLERTPEANRTPEQLAAIAEAKDDAQAARASIKRVKHGFYSAAMEESSGAQLASDRTRMYQTPNRHDDLSHMIERTEDPSGVFHNRPRRFYKGLEFEENKIATRNVVSGNSATQERAIRDQMFDTLHTLRDVFTQGPAAAMGRGAQLLFERFFGLSSDVNVALARKLASTNPAIHDEAYRELSMRVGRSRSDIFRHVMEQYRREATASAAGAAPSVSEGR